MISAFVSSRIPSMSSHAWGSSCGIGPAAGASAVSTGSRDIERRPGASRAATAWFPALRCSANTASAGFGARCCSSGGSRSSQALRARASRAVFVGRR